MVLLLKDDVLPSREHTPPSGFEARIQPEILLAIMVAEGVYASQGVRDLTITSLVDGVHSNNSLHYKGQGVDLRTKGTGLGQRLFEGIRKALPKGYDVLLEDKDGVNEHIHIEWDPK